MARLLPSLGTAIIALAAGFLGAWGFAASGLGDNAIRSFMLANPEILPRMAQKYQEQEGARRLAAVESEAMKPFPGAVIGNPDGPVTLVQFTDYACGYCRQNAPVIKEIVAKHPDVRVVVREWPIFDGSELTARLALAAARQGKYVAFHDAMYAAGPPTPATIEASARKAGLDLAAAKAFMASPEATLELRKNLDIAQRLGFSGTPSWIIGGKTSEGFLDAAQLDAAIEAARKKTT